jgi:hypothetical protein
MSTPEYQLVDYYEMHSRANVTSVTVLQGNAVWLSANKEPGYTGFFTV